jgi:hypothetical protein
MCADCPQLSALEAAVVHCREAPALATMAGKRRGLRLNAEFAAAPAATLVVLGDDSAAALQGTCLPARPERGTLTRPGPRSAPACARGAPGKHVEDRVQVRHGAQATLTLPCLHSNKDSECAVARQRWFDCGASMVRRV